MPYKGAENGTRTRDPDLGKVVLHQLSHSRISQTINFAVLFSSTRHIISYEPKNVNPFFTGSIRFFSNQYSVFTSSRAIP